MRPCSVIVNLVDGECLTIQRMLESSVKVSEIHRFSTLALFYYKQTVIKGMLKPKMNICWKYTFGHWIELFQFLVLILQFSIRTDLETFSNCISCLANGSSAVNGWRQNESPKKLIKTFNPHPVHQITSCETKSSMFVRNKSIIKTSNHSFWQNVQNP